jgi:DNA-binding transcriptional LysR family regulator
LDRVKLMHILIAVADKEGFAGAARHLKISPPAVTRAINELERRLGVRLFTRTTRVVQITDAGESYIEDCRRIVAELAAADENVGGFSALPRGLLTLTAPAWFGAKFVAPIVTEYLQKHPDVQADCWFLDRVVNLIEEGVDVAVRIAELEDSSVQAIPVGRMRMVVVAAPEYLRQHRALRKPEDLLGHSIVAATSVAPGSDWRFRARGRDVKIRLQPRLRTTTNEAAISAAAAGFGLTQQMHYKVADLLAEGRLETVLTDHAPDPLPVNLLHREGRYASRRVRLFLDLAIERFRALPELH